MRLTLTGWGCAVVSLLVIALQAPAAPALVRDLRGDSFPDAALAIASLVLLVVAAWTATITAAVLLGASSTVVAALTPRFARGAVLVGVAGALAVAPAHAEQQAPGAGGAQVRPAHHTVDGLPLPDRPDVASSRPASAVVPGATSTPEPRPADTVEVRPGDTLWTIAANRLPPDATVAEVAGATRQWHEANRAVIGDDPDLIVPHQLLTPPSGKASS